MTSWFRSWHGAPTDTKWLLIARRAGVPPGIVSAVAWALLDYASQQPERGSVDGFDVETYAAFSGFEEADIRAVIEAMTTKEIIVSGRLASWEKRQPEREDNSSERVRRYRESRNAVAVTAGDVTHGNAAKHTVTHSNAPDTDTDTDTEEMLTANAVSTPAEPPAPEPAPKTKRAAGKKPPDANMQHPAVVAFREETNLNPNHTQAAAIVAAVPEADVEKWRDTVRRWLMAGWRSTGVDGMLERYRDGWERNGKANRNGNNYRGLRSAARDVDPATLRWGYIDGMETVGAT